MEALQKLYKKLWERVGKRSWTEIIRDDQRNAPLGYMLIFLALGVLVARLCGKCWWVLTGFALGILVGHFWW